MAEKSNKGGQVIFLLAAILIVLLLLLTGNFIPVLAFSFKAVGWVLVIVLAVALVWLILARLFGPVVDWGTQLAVRRDTRRRRRLRAALGYEDDIEPGPPGYSNSTADRVREERRRLGY